MWFCVVTKEPCGSSALVCEVGDKLQVVFVPTKALVAQVIDLFVAWDVPIEVGVGNQVNGHGVIVEGHAAISPTSSSPRCRACP